MKEGEDFYLIDYSEKYLFDTFEIPPRGLTVLTESGYLLLVKSFTDKLAWQVQRLLVNAYFRNVEKNTETLTNLTTETKRELINKYQVATHVIQYTFRVALFIGIHVNQARQFAINRAFKETGINYDELLILARQTAIVACTRLDDKTKPRIPSQLGFLVNKPAMRINSDLQKKGLQWRDNYSQWRPTKQGKKYCADTPPRACKGHHPLFWYPKVLEVLYPEILIS